MKKFPSLFIAATVTSLTLLSGTAVTTAYAANVEGPKVDWNLSMWGKPRGFTKGLEAFSEEVSKQTDGNFNIKIHYGSTLSKPKENLDGISLGAFQMAVTCMSYHPGKVPSGTVLDMPFVPFTDMYQQADAHDAVLNHSQIVKEFARWNAVTVMPALLPNYVPLGRGKAPEKIEDWNGLRIRALGGQGHAMKTLDAVPVAMPSPEIYTALERGAIDAVALAYYAHKAFGIIDIAEWYVENMDLGSVACAVVANADALKKLPKQYKQLLKDAKAPALKAQIEGYKTSNDLVGQNLPKSIKKITYSADTIAKFQAKAAQPTWDAWVKKNAKHGPSQEIFDLLMSKSAAAK